MNAQVFVVGNSRSGTTMVARALALGPEAADLGELHFIEQMVTGADFLSSEPLPADRAATLAARLISIVRHGYLHAGTGYSHMSEAEDLVGSEQTASELFETIRRHETGRVEKSVPVDQTPRNVFYAHEILAMYNNARIVCLVRDPRDVCLSQKRKWRRRYLGADIPFFEALRAWSNYHPWVTSSLWVRAVRAGDELADHPRMLVVRFEDLTAEPERVIRRICDHCGLKFTTEMLDVDQVGSSDRADVAGKQGIDPSRVGSWEHALSNAEVAICESRAGELLARHGYIPSTTRASVVSRAAWMAALPVKSTLALALNVRRVGNVVSWARQRMRT